MSLLNRNAAELMLPHRPSACTDVTGFGLIGHACEMALGAGVTIELQLLSIPLMAGVLDQIANGMIPAGCYQNRSYCQPKVSACEQDTDRILPLFDPQTSGGLMIAFAPENAENYLHEAAEKGVFAVRIGAVQSYQGHSIRLSTD